MSFFKKLFGIKEKEDESVFPKPYIAPSIHHSTSIDEIMESSQTDSFTKEQPKSQDSFESPLEKSIPKKSIPVNSEKIPVKNFKEGSKPEDWNTFEKDGKEGYEDEDGNVVIPAIFDEADLFNEGLAVVGIGEKYGMINVKGEYILKIEYDFVFDVKEGMILVQKNDLSGFALPDGSFQIPLQYDDAGEFCEGLSAVSKNDKTGFIDNKNNTVLDFNFNSAGDFTNGLAYASPYSLSGAEKFGFIDKTGNFVIDPQFEEAGNFKEDLAPVKIGEKWAYCNRSGQVVGEPLYYDANDFYSGLSCVQKEKKGKWGYADKTGKLVIDYQFDYSSNFMDNGKAYVFINKKCFTLSPDGTMKK